jgi:hypothetical protein
LCTMPLVELHAAVERRYRMPPDETSIERFSSSIGADKRRLDALLLDSSGCISYTG